LSFERKLRALQEITKAVVAIHIYRQGHKECSRWSVRRDQVDGALASEIDQLIQDHVPGRQGILVACSVGRQKSSLFALEETDKRKASKKLLSENWFTQEPPEP
jgi:hypothetical protein